MAARNWDDDDGFGGSGKSTDGPFKLVNAWTKGNVQYIESERHDKSPFFYDNEEFFSDSSRGSLSDNADYSNNDDPFKRLVDTIKDTNHYKTPSARYTKEETESSNTDESDDNAQPGEENNPFMKMVADLKKTKPKSGKHSSADRSTPKHPSRKPAEDSTSKSADKPYELQEDAEVEASFLKLSRPEKLRDLCKRFGRKSPQLKLACDMICNEIRLLQGVKYVYSAYMPTDDNTVTFVVTIEIDQEQHVVETFIKDIGIEYKIKMLQFKNNETNGIEHRSNKRQTDVEIKRLRECINTHAPKLFVKHKYLSIIQGCMRQVNNKETEETSNFEAYLELYVHAKGCIPIEEDPFEKMYNGITVHVCDGVFLPFTKHADAIHDTIRMGCTISRRYERSGTLGLFFEHVQYGLCGIGSAHVLLCDTELEQCTMQRGKYLPQNQREVYQPRFPDVIGKLVEVIYKKGDTTLPGLEIGLIAIENRKPENGRFPDPTRGKQLDINYSSGRADTPRVNNLKCVKFGSATNYTTGIIERLTLPNGARTLPWTLRSGLTELTLYNQLRIEPTETTEPFADFGDSGAPVFVIDGDGQPVCIGIVAGGVSDSRTVMVTPITVILEELGISKFKTFKPNLETLQQDINTMKHQLAALVQHLLPPRSENA